MISGNGYIISPCSSLNSRSVVASHEISNQCKSKKPLSAAKACIPQILPSKFKPLLLPPSGTSEESRTTGTQHPKAHSCGDLYTPHCDTDNAEKSECLDDLGNVCPAIRRSAVDFSSLYRTMHNIQRPSSVGCSPHGSVRSLASLFEKAKSERNGRLEADDEGGIPRDSVLSRVNEFEIIIQRSNSAPSRSSSLPTLHSSPNHSPSHRSALHMPSAVSAESLLVTNSVQTLISSKVEVGIPNSQGDALSPDTVTVEKAACSSEDGQNTRTDKCKGSCPASYTRFTTILRHERQQANSQQEKAQPLEKKTMLPGNLLLMGPAPFRLRKNPKSNQTRRSLLATKVTADMTKPSRLSSEIRPLIPQRLSSFEVLDKLTTEEEDDTENLSNGQGLDANGNVLQPLAAYRRGGYLHPFTTVTLLLWSLTSTLLSLRVPSPPPKQLCHLPSVVSVKVPGDPPFHSMCAVSHFTVNLYEPTHSPRHLRDCRQTGQGFWLRISSQTSDLSCMHVC
uniref:Uncharacterized protein n=1 Tax=Gouania willdenowi TaxID=441366 RepID=A0A8C5I8Y5_GOUWI